MTPGFFAILSAMIGYGVLHSILASLSLKALAERLLGDWVSRVYRLFFSAMAVLTFLPVVALFARLPDKPIYTLPAPWSYLVLGFQVVSVMGMLISVWQTGFLNFIGFSQILADPTTSKPDLVTGGFYHWMRHPIYTFSMAFLWLMPFMSWNILGFNIGTSAYFIIGAIFEERKLRREFGQAYIDYARQTPRFIPGVKFL